MGWAYFGTFSESLYVTHRWLTRMEDHSHILPLPLISEQPRYKLHGELPCLMIHQLGPHERSDLLVISEMYFIGLCWWLCKLSPCFFLCELGVDNMNARSVLTRESQHFLNRETSVESVHPMAFTPKAVLSISCLTDSIFLSLKYSSVQMQFSF